MSLTNDSFGNVTEDYINELYEVLQEGLITPIQSDQLNTKSKESHIIPNRKNISIYYILALQNIINEQFNQKLSYKWINKKYIYYSLPIMCICIAIIQTLSLLLILNYIHKEYMYINIDNIKQSNIYTFFFICILSLCIFFFNTSETDFSVLYFVNHKLKNEKTLLILNISLVIKFISYTITSIILFFIILCIDKGLNNFQYFCNGFVVLCINRIDNILIQIDIQNNFNINTNNSFIKLLKIPFNFLIFLCFFAPLFFLRIYII